MASSQPEFGASDSRQALLLQYLQLRTEDLGLQGLELEVSGFGGAHAGDAPLVDPIQEDGRFRGNLLVGLLRWQSKHNTISISLGRQYLFGGAGRAEHLDGLSFTYRSRINLDVTVFGGRTMPWQLDYDQAEPSVDSDPWTYTNYAAGGRLRYRLLDQAVASAGFIHEGNGSDTVRQCLAFDAGYWGFRKIEGLAGGIVDIASRQLQEVWAQLISRPIRRLKISADYTFQVPALAIPKTSIFSVFTTDAYHDASAGVHYGITPLISAGVEGGVRLFPEEPKARLGYTVAGSVRVALGTALPGRYAGLRVELLDAVEDMLLTSRLFARYRFAFGLYANAELYVLYFRPEAGAGSSIFQQRLDQHATSIGGLGLVGYQFTPRVSLHISGGIFSTPRAKHDIRALARLTYAGTWGGGR